MTKTFYHTRWDTRVWIISILFSLFLIGVPAYGAIVSYIHHTTSNFALIYGPMIAVASLIATIIFAPRGYLLTADEIRVIRFAPDIHIKLSEIEKVSLVDGGEVFSNATRVGSGGAFGIYGRFYSSSVPKFQAYVTHTDRLVMITRKNTMPIVLSPVEMDEFLQQLRKQNIAIDGAKKKR